MRVLFISAQSREINIEFVCIAVLWVLIDCFVILVAGLLFAFSWTKYGLHHEWSQGRVIMVLRSELRQRQP